MKAITYNDAFTWLSGIKNENQFPGVILLYGEPFFTNELLNTLYQRLAGMFDIKTPAEILNGDDTNLSEIIEELSTFSFFSACKIVALRQVQWFATASGEAGTDAGSIDAFSEVIRKGLPEKHYLIMTAPSVDKRKQLYKLIQELGLVIDCTIPQGNRKKDLQDQEQIFRGVSTRILLKHKKEIVPQAFLKLFEMTGIDLELFARNLEKLVAFSGKKPLIEVDDVLKVVVRDRKDPIFDLTNAVFDKDVELALFVLDSLMKNGFHELAILKTLENQIRKLLLARCVYAQLFPDRSSSVRQMGFNRFKSVILPKIAEHDQAVADQDASLNALFEPAANEKKSKVKNDLLLAPNIKNAYPVFQIFLKSENFSLTRLLWALQQIAELDFQFKSSATNARIRIENFIIQLCGKGGLTDDLQKNQNYRHHL